MRSSFFKTFFLSLLVVSFMYLSSCKDEDATNDLLGTWVATSILNTTCNTASNDGTTELTCTDEDCIRLTFSDDSVYEFEITENMATRSDAGTVIIDGRNMDLCEEEEGVSNCETFSFSVNSTTLVLTNTDEFTGCLVRTTYMRE